MYIAGNSAGHKDSGLCRVRTGARDAPLRTSNPIGLGFRGLGFRGLGFRGLGV